MINKFMSDLNRINGGLKLLNYILKTQVNNVPWSKENLYKRAKIKPNNNKLKKK